MTYDIPTLATAMDQKITQLDHVAHNLANAMTPGFKARHQYFPEVLSEEIAGAATPDTAVGVVVDHAPGLAQQTGNPLDLSLQGNGFFVVQTPQGEAFTRKGDFSLNKFKQIVTQSGDPVSGEGGPIVVSGGKLHIDEEGAVYEDNNQIGKLRLVDFADRNALILAGDGLYRDEGNAGLKKADGVKVQEGSLELSNVNVIQEMTEMIAINRTFETYQKLIQTLTEQQKLATNSIGQVS